jgi:hypothetical protein
VEKMADRAVYKSSSVESLDRFFDDSSDQQLADAYERGRQLLAATAGRRLSQAAVDLVNTGHLPEGSVEHSDRGWRASSSVDRVIRHAYEEAMRLASAKTPRQRIETLWVTGASEVFEIHICEGMRHVILLLFIPETRSYGSHRAEARSWVVRSTDERDLPLGTRVLDGEEPRVVLTQVSGSRSEAAAEGRSG